MGPLDRPLVQPLDKETQRGPERPSVDMYNKPVLCLAGWLADSGAG